MSTSTVTLGCVEESEPGTPVSAGGASDPSVTVEAAVEPGDGASDDTPLEQAPTINKNTKNIASRVCG
jgi:hypothetical protein